MLQEFTSYISSIKLFKPGERILLAVSGGVDSVAMVKLFSDAGFSYGIAHVNFKLRGEDSERDESFVKSLAESNDVAFHLKHFNTKQYAADNKLSIQVAARNLRYAWFDEMMDLHGYAFVATAHHLDDQAETFFINLLRGTGISGMHGILPKQGRVIRPLMFTTRNKVMEYAVDQQLNWRDDRSNKSRKYLRNRLRLDVLPELSKISPNFSLKLSDAINHLRDVETIFNNHMAGVRVDMVQKTEEGTLISIDWIYEYEPHETYLFELLKPYDFTYPVVREIVRSLDTFSGKTFFSPTHRLLRDRENFIIQPVSDLPADPEVDQIGFFYKGDTKIEFPVCLRADETTSISDLPIGKKSVACLDLEKLVFPLKIRKWEKGDWFVPLGLKGKKKLSDFFVDQKFSLADKEKAYLLVSGEDIVWVIGQRIDNRYKITSKTKKAFVISCKSEDTDSETYTCGCSLLFS